MFDAERATKILMEKGYLLDIHMPLWMGSVMVYPEDLCVGVRLLPTAKQSIQVASKAWVKRVSLLRESLRRNTTYSIAPLIRFEGASHRFVFEPLLKVVATSLDKASVKMEKFYEQFYLDPNETTRIARAVLTRNADILWRSVSHLYHGCPNKLVAPEDWKIKMINFVMDNRFPDPQHFKSMRVSYHIYRTEDLPTIGQYQKKSPGLVTDCSILSRILQRSTDQFIDSIKNRIKLFELECKLNGIHIMSYNQLQIFLPKIKAFNPIDVGYGFNESVSNLENYLVGVNGKIIHNDPIKRKETVELLKSLLEIMEGPWKKERADTYLDLFGPTKLPRKYYGKSGNDIQPQGFF